MASVKVKMTIVVIMGVLLGAESTPNINIIEWRCNVNFYSDTDAYADNVNYVLTDLVKQTPYALAYDYYSKSPSNSDICYGHATCNTALSYTDCSDCLFSAASTDRTICDDRVGGMVQMVDCTIRYENYPF